MPADALKALAAQLRDDESVISPYVREPDSPPALGAFVAAGPHTGAEPAAYALVVEAVREGYLLHYGEPRVLDGADADLRLLAGDYLYALGLERLAGLGDLPAVRQLSDLISLSAQLHAEGDPHGSVDSLWLATITAIATGSDDALDAPKAALRAGDRSAREALDLAAEAMADAAGMGGRLANLRDGIDFRAARSN